MILWCIMTLCRDKEHRQSGRTEDVVRSLHRDRSFSGPLTAGADRAVQDIRPGNGVQGAPRPTSGMISFIPLSLGESIKYFV